MSKKNYGVQRSPRFDKSISDISQIDNDGGLTDDSVMSSNLFTNKNNSTKKPIITTSKKNLISTKNFYSAPQNNDYGKVDVTRYSVKNSQLNPDTISSIIKDKFSRSKPTTAKVNPKLMIDLSKVKTVRDFDDLRNTFDIETILDYDQDWDKDRKLDPPYMTSKMFNIVNFVLLFGLFIVYMSVYLYRHKTVSYDRVKLFSSRTLDLDKCNFMVFCLDELLN